MKKKETSRHGDVQIIKVDSLPADAVLQEGRNWLALGEVSGHAHRVDALSEIFETKDGLLYLKVKKPSKLSHEEHSSKVLEPGIYRVGIKRQYNAETGWSRVLD